MPNKKPYITIKNFSKFQHYQEGKRQMIWLKLYFKILDSSRFFNLTEFERWVFIGLLVLSGMKKNKIPYEKNFLKAKILHYETDMNLLDKAINSLIREDLIAIKMLSNSYQDASLDIEEEEDKDKEKESVLFFPSIQKYFTSAYKTKFGEIPSIDFGKEGKLVKGKIKIFKSLEDAYRLIDIFLDSQKAKDCGYTLSVCFSSHTINAWKAKELGGQRETEDEAFDRITNQQKNETKN